MAGLYTNGLQNLPTTYGGEKIAVDTKYAGGQNPQSVGIGFNALAAMVAYLSNTSSKTTVSGTRYYSSFDLNAANPSAQDGGAVEAAPVFTATGIVVAVGSTGGTDNWIVELHDSNGVLLATSTTSGTTAGTANTWQQIPFTATLSLVPQTYFLVVQSNGTTAHPLVYNFPAPVVQTTPLITGSVTGTFGTSANFTPATTYTAAAGPMALLY